MIDSRNYRSSLLDGPAGQTGWTDQLDGSAGWISSLYLKPWPVCIFEDCPFSLYIVAASESDEGLVFFYVSPEELNGGLNQRTFLFLHLFFLFVGASSLWGVNFNLCLYPLLASASWNWGAAFSKISWFDDKLDILLFTPSGMLFKTAGGCLLRLWTYWGVLLGLL